MSANLRMIDVSANNHGGDRPIGWAVVGASGVDAVMVKATEGTGYENPWLVLDARGATTAGLEVGFYHFAHPSQSSPEVQAAAAVRACAGLHHDLGLALDLEVSEGLGWPALAAWAQAFHAEVRKTYDHAPLYVNDDFLDNLPGAPWGERLWLAQTDRPRRECWAWQETTPATVPGITGDVDAGYLHPSV